MLQSHKQMCTIVWFLLRRHMPAVIQLLTSWHTGCNRIDHNLTTGGMDMKVITVTVAAMG